MKSFAYPAIKYIQYRLQGTIVNPLTSLELPVNYTLGLFEYSGGIWPMFLDEYYTDMTTVRKVWETAGNNPAITMLSAIDLTLQQHYNSALTEALKK